MIPTKIHLRGEGVARATGFTAFKIMTCIVLILSVFSCKQQQKKENTEVQEGSDMEPHWSYMGETGPEHWSEIEKNSNCKGSQQSPINISAINTVKDSSLGPITFHYAKNIRLHDIINNGHSIQYNFEKGDYIKVNGKRYDLIQFHFHEASEHTLNGLRFPLEIHLVHATHEKELLVLGVMAIEGEKSLPFTFLEKYLPIAMGQTKKIDTAYDMSMNLPADKGYYTYKGSLTTPPCTEEVEWFVFKNPITVSKEQITMLQALMPMNNYRNVQPLNGRTVRAF